jgi:integrase/recombinase XerD
MKTWLEEFLHYVTVEKGYSRNTAVAYRNDLSQFVTYLADRAVFSWRDVTSAHILEYVRDLEAQGYASSTVARKLATIKSFFHFLAVDGLLGDDPTVAVDFPLVDKRLPRPLTPEEMTRLLLEPAKSRTPRALRDWAMLELMYATGMRVSEVIGLEVDSVDLEAKEVRCSGTGNRERILPLYDRACEALSIYLEHGRPGLLRVQNERVQNEKVLFVSRLGKSLTRQGLWLIIKRYAAAAGIERTVTPHTLRHSFATHLLDGDIGLRKVQRLLGHTSIASTQVYTEVSARRKQEARAETHSERP